MTLAHDVYRTASDATQASGTPGASPVRQGQAEPLPAKQEQARSLLNYAWKHVFELPGLPSALRYCVLLMDVRCTHLSCQVVRGDLTSCSFNAGEPFCTMC